MGVLDLAGAGRSSVKPDPLKFELGDRFCVQVVIFSIAPLESGGKVRMDVVGGSARAIRVRVGDCRRQATEQRKDVPEHSHALGIMFSKTNDMESMERKAPEEAGLQIAQFRSDHFSLVNRSQTWCPLTSVRFQKWKCDKARCSGSRSIVA